MLGQLINASKTGNTRVLIDMTAYAEGQYIIKLTTDAGIKNIKVLKK